MNIISIQVKNLMTSATRTAVEERYLGPSILIVLEYLNTNTKAVVCTIKTTRLTYFKLLLGLLAILLDYLIQFT